MYQNDPQRVLTGEVRLSYVNLVTPRPPKDNPQGTPKYSVTLLIPKTDTITLTDIRNSILAAAEAATPGPWKGFRLPDDRLFSILHDGDGVNNSGKPYGPECKGHWVLSANTTQKPDVVDQSNINVSLAPTDIYSGMYGRVTVRFYGTDKGGNKMCCGLGNVMKTREGDPLSGGASAASDFAGVGQSVDNVAAAPGYGYAAPAQAPAYAAPVQSPGYGYSAPTGGINPLTGLPM